MIWAVVMTGQSKLLLRGIILGFATNVLYEAFHPALVSLNKDMISI